MLGYSYSQNTANISCYIDNKLDNKHIKSTTIEQKVNSTHEIANKIWLNFIMGKFTHLTIKTKAQELKYLFQKRKSEVDLIL